MDVFKEMLDSKRKLSKLHIENTNICAVLRWLQNHIKDEGIKKAISDFLQSDKTAIPDFMTIEPSKEDITKMGYPLPQAPNTPLVVPGMSKDEIREKVDNTRQSIYDEANKPIKKT
jgi:hypothetical protein